MRTQFEGIAPANENASRESRKNYSTLWVVKSMGGGISYDVVDKKSEIRETDKVMAAYRNGMVIDPNKAEEASKPLVFAPPTQKVEEEKEETLVSDLVIAEAPEVFDSPKIETPQDEPTAVKSKRGRKSNKDAE